jgi:radical SAM superfamily enzyme YgiQ (UPF0313 family)
MVSVSRNKKSLDLLLINPALERKRKRGKDFTLHWVEGGHGWIPLPVLFLASYLVPRGFSVKVVDMELYDSRDEGDLLTQYVPSARFVGISAMTAQVHHGLALTKRVKEICDEVPVIWGGIHASLLPEQTVAHPLVDYVVRGEGEESLFCLLSGKDHPHIGTKSKPPDPSGAQDFVAIENIGDPDYGLLEIERYFAFQGGRFRNVDVMTSRGCPMRCSFCVNTILHNKWRAFSVERSLAIIRKVREAYNCSHIFLMDENFFGDPSRASGIVSGLVSLGITWEANITVKKAIALENDFLKVIRESGCVRLRMGAESASDRLLMILRKNITSEQIVQARDRILGAGVTPVLSFMTDLPDELPEEKLATMTLARESEERGARVIGPQTFRPYPGSEEFDKLVQRGLRIPDSLQAWARSDLFGAVEQQLSFRRKIRRILSGPWKLMSKINRAVSSWRLCIGS